MAIKIEQSADIPVTINSMEFKFDSSDENIKRLANIDEIIEKKLSKSDFKQNATEEIERVTSEEIEEGLKNAGLVAKVGFDEILGKGSFEKIYKSCPSILKVLDIFTAVIDGLYEEIKDTGKRMEQNQSEKAQSYLKAKKAKAKK
ncbi:hypothetical protein HB912_12200 [Listeria aquatica]|uniref:Uncharacterized protein n=1 Tax=Listeria aquatica TaxID=1494960 RepID=A0A841ZP28_9LIST|nr:hypothetical protein [Listeria aquatica]MBC1522409.1 hypothetical protein [Listeria aquatica]